MSDAVLDAPADEVDEPPATTPGGHGAAAPSVLVEIVLALGVLAATSVLVAEPRGKEAVATRELRPVRPRPVISATGGP